MCSSPIDFRIAVATEVLPEPVPPAIATTRTGRSKNPLDGDGMLFPLIIDFAEVVSLLLEVEREAIGLDERVFLYIIETGYIGK